LTYTLASFGLIFSGAKMGKRGPAKTPTNVKQFRGTYRGDRAVNEARPAPARTLPPRWLKDKAARAIYKRIAEVLSPAGLATTADQQALARLAQLEALQDQVLAGDLSLTVPGSQGQPVANPAYRYIIDLHSQIEKLYSRFGMTPSARAGINIPDQGDHSDPMEDLLEGSS
jgi:P27 family predicted phage terminase small subunit